MGGLDQAGGTAIGTIRFVEAAVHTVGDDVGDAAAIGAHNGAAGCHGLQQHQTEGFRAGGEQEGIAAGVGAGQLLAGQVPHEGGGGAAEVFLQLLPVGAIPHQGQTGVGQGFQHRADPFDLLFSGQASDVEQQGTAIVVPP